MMAKAPVPGRAKTRLSPPFNDEQCAEWATAFALDTWSSLSMVSGARRVLAWTGNESALPGALRSAERFPQVGEDLGARMVAAAAQCMSNGGCAVLVGSDLPGLPAEHVISACELLGSCDAVIGPSADGGYYLLGFSRVEDGLLDGLPWSSELTRASTEQRLAERGYSIGYAPTFDDVDELSDLRRALASGRTMEHTQRLARELSPLF